ncbi:transcription elongation factor elongin A [Megachile rotundata]|uniref:transcription elongation factor elongin A n=1 Tax=Megachile rotundata TaxID=143995 RepID=UPI000258D4E8|nr:PREDICTED: transcription elongation factor B polypeptide 3 [Megachile rotundata]XP_012134766.1 PREDICTED: transcription elongation factor B polypeptide 3 [Megachile rotundata]XP_012134767.1 PREDICTED: transcription elongation factor B polypeptide 3 [Megachile rotundata]XP_012134769.1 PREDICTED: transcription elongation factor B polypeptide 3 [Megachile rotundata]
MSVVDKIKHYQRNIEKCDDNEDRILHCISKLSNLPVTVQHLQETGVGRTVNALRKYEGGIGDAAKALVAKWKTMVANEESSEGEDEDEACVPDVPESYNDNRESPKSEESAVRHKSEGSGKYMHRHKTEKAEVSHTSHNSKHSSKHESKVKSVESQSKSNCDTKILDNDLEKQKKYDKHKHIHKHESRSDKRSSKDNKSASKNDDTHVSKSHSHNKSDNLEKYSNRSSCNSSLSKNSEENHKKRKNDDSNTSRKESKRRKNSESENEESKFDISSNSEKHNVNSALGIIKIKEEPKDKEVLNKHEIKPEIKHEKKDSQEKVKGSSSKHRTDSSSSKLKESGDKYKYKSETHTSSSKDETKKVDSHYSNKDSSESKYSNSSSHDKHCDKNKDRSKKKEHKEGKSKHDSKSSKESKHSKQGSKEPKELVKIKQEMNGDEGIDCHSGASFAEALGMCTMAQLSKKRSNNSPSSSSAKIIKPEQSVTNNKKTTKTEPATETLQPPSLLSSSVKLEPLNVDLASTLPEISPNYKPLPYVNPIHRKEEDKALTDVMYVKNQRTKVYSGNKSGYTTVPTLFELCTRILMDNIDALEFTGGVPFDILKPILERATSDQLFMLEHYNPYLIEDTDVLWQFHCNREFRNKQREEMETWREMYMRCLDEREAKLKALTANIKQSIDKSVPVRSTKLAYVDNVVKPPRNILKKQAKYGTANCVPSTASTLKKKLISGGGNPADATNIAVPPPPMSRAKSSSGVVKKTKAPLMAKALQLIKGRYKR